jgi:hypothetical protein
MSKTSQREVTSLSSQIKKYLEANSTRKSLEVEDKIEGSGISSTTKRTVLQQFVELPDKLPNFPTTRLIIAAIDKSGELFIQTRKNLKQTETFLKLIMKGPALSFNDPYVSIKVWDHKRNLLLNLKPKTPLDTIKEGMKKILEENETTKYEFPNSTPQKNEITPEVLESNTFAVKEMKKNVTLMLTPAQAEAMNRVSKQK